MKRNELLGKGIMAFGRIVALTGIVASKSMDKEVVNETSEDCVVSPQLTKGPFPNETPLGYVQENIIEDRKGVAMLMPR